MPHAPRSGPQVGTLAAAAPLAPHTGRRRPPRSAVHAAAAGNGRATHMCNHGAGWPLPKLEAVAGAVVEAKVAAALRPARPRLGASDTASIAKEVNGLAPADASLPVIDEVSPGFGCPPAAPAASTDAPVPRMQWLVICMAPTIATSRMQMREMDQSCVPRRFREGSEKVPRSCERWTSRACRGRRGCR